MTPEEHLLSVKIEERVKELRYAIRFYDEFGWDGLAAEYRIRLEELEKLLPKKAEAAA